MASSGTILGIWLDDSAPNQSIAWLANCLALARWLRTQAHFLVPSSQIAAFKLASFPTELQRQIGSIKMAEAPSASLVEEALSFQQQLRARLVLLPHPQSGLRPKWSSLSQKICQESQVPIVFIPEQRTFSKTPFSSLVVPISGERKACNALDYGLELAERGHLPVDLIHITSRADEISLGAKYDQIHHEYPGQVEQLILRSSPLASPLRRLRIRQIEHVHGEIYPSLKKLIMRHQLPLVILEWEGHVEPGRAQLIKSILQELAVPILLILARPRPEARLRVGQGFQPGGSNETGYR